MVEEYSIKENKMKSLPLSDVMSLIKGANIKYMAEYRRFVLENNFQSEGFPLYPEYGKNFPGVDTFLGNPDGTAEKCRSIVRGNTARIVKPWKQVKNPGRVAGSVNAPKVVVVEPVKETQTPSLASIIRTLHSEYNIPLDSLYQLNKDAKSSSNMKIEAINETLTVLVEIAMSKTKVKVS